MRWLVAVCLYLGLSALGRADTPPDDRPVVLKPARVFDGVNPAPHTDWVVVVRGQRLQGHDERGGCEGAPGFLRAANVAVQIGSGQRHDERRFGEPAAEPEYGSGAAACVQGDQRIALFIFVVRGNRDPVPQGSQHARPALGCHPVTI